MSVSPCGLLLEAAERHPRRPAVLTDGEAIDYAELARRSLAVARQLGPPGNNPRVALLADNGPSYVVLYWGLLCSGRVSVELNPGLGDSELAAQLEGTEPELLLAEPRHARRLGRLGLHTTGGKLNVARPGGASTEDAALASRLSGAVEGHETEPVGEPAWRPGADAPASIVHTSGTTGQVKGVCLSHGNLAWTTAAIAASFGLGRDEGEERFAGNLPLFYTYGKSVLLVATHAAAPIVFTRGVGTPENLLRLVATERVTHLSLVPYLCSLLLRSPRFAAEGLPGLRRLTIAGGALLGEPLAEMLRRFPGRVMPMYGLTEASTRVTCMPAGEAERRGESCGRPLQGVEVKTVRGEVLVRGPNVMQGYFRDPRATRRAIRGGWLRTGDLGSLDAEGYLRLSGRRKEVIKIMGESVSALRVEAAVAELPQVAEVAVRGVSDAVRGEAICAFVVARAGTEPSADAIRRHCAETLGRAYVPTHVRFVDRLPKTASGKVRKHLLMLD